MQCMHKHDILPARRCDVISCCARVVHASHRLHTVLLTGPKHLPSWWKGMLQSGQNGLMEKPRLRCSGAVQQVITYLLTLRTVCVASARMHNITSKCYNDVSIGFRLCTNYVYVCSATCSLHTVIAGMHDCAIPLQITFGRSRDA